MMYTVKFLANNTVIYSERVFLTKEQKERLENQKDVVVR